VSVVGLEKSRPPADDGDGMHHEVRVTGFWSLRYERTPLARYDFGWPSGTIAVRDRKLVLDAHQPFAALNHVLLRRSKYPVPIVVPVEAITSLRIREGAIGSARISSDDPTFRRLRFGALGQRFTRVVETLRQLGVPVE